VKSSPISQIPAHPSILIVEDEPLISWSLTNALTKRGFDATIAESAEKAAELFETTRIDLVISDIKLPLADGFELSKIIRRRNPDMPIIIITAGEEDERFQSEEMKGVHYCEKPFHLDEVVEMVNSILGQAIVDDKSGKSKNFSDDSHQ
jgi:DNA-binding response OmpR family regulator